jgi:hypothetical protein
LTGKAVAEERHRLAHWMLGYSKEIKSGLLLLDPRDGLRQLSHNISETRAKNFLGTIQLSPNDIRVLSNKHLNELIKRLENYLFDVRVFVGALFLQEGGDWDDEISDREYQMLYSDPQIHAAIVRLRGGQKKGRAAHQRRHRSGRKQKRK